MITLSLGKGAFRDAPIGTLLRIRSLLSFTIFMTSKEKSYFRLLSIYLDLDLAKTRTSQILLSMILTYSIFGIAGCLGQHFGGIISAPSCRQDSPCASYVLAYNGCRGGYSLFCRKFNLSLFLFFFLLVRAFLNFDLACLMISEFF
jgi:hypothetical protein